MVANRSASLDGDLIGYMCGRSYGIGSYGYYAIIITKTRFIGVKKVPFWGRFGGFCYFGPGSKESDSRHIKCVERAAKLSTDRDVDLGKDSILKAVYKRRALHDGHVVIKSTKGNYTILLTASRRSSPAPYMIRTLLDSLLQLVPDKLYDEENGNLVADDLKNGKDYL